MSRKPITAFQLFKVLMSILIYLSVSVAWLLFAARDLISSSSDIDVAGGFFGTVVWLIATACLFLHITTQKPGQSATTTEKDQ
jgi:succinate-acetate transporter protein